MKFSLVIFSAIISMTTAATYPSCPNCPNERIKRSLSSSPETENKISPIYFYSKYSDPSGKYVRDDRDTIRAAKPNKSGRYKHDDSGKYVHQDVPYRHNEWPNTLGRWVYDGSGNYIHQDFPYIHIKGPEGGFGPDWNGNDFGSDFLECYPRNADTGNPFGPSPGKTHPNSIYYTYLPVEDDNINTSELTN